MYFRDNQLFHSASDLVNFLGCEHLTHLELQHARGDIDRPQWSQSMQVLQDLGNEHESNYIQHMRDEGLTVVDLSENRKVEATLAAMKEGPDRITQARLQLGNWVGYADILIKKEGSSDLGDYHYEVADTKLAQVTKAGTILQLSLYAEIVASLQGRRPELMYVVKPGEDFPTESFRVDDFAAYYQWVKRKFVASLQDGSLKDTYPEPVSKCSSCVWWSRCDKQWRKDDHLSLVAGIRQANRKELEKKEIKRLDAYVRSGAPFPGKPEKGSMKTYEKLHSQASIQLQGREEGKLLHKLYDNSRTVIQGKDGEIEVVRGLNRLPVPSEGDIIFDIEGDRYYHDGPLEYLFGYLVRKNGQWSYRKLWARNRNEEREVLRQFIDEVFEIWEQHPGFHIYHYAPYEPSAIGRLASRHALYEDKVDRLLRAGRFVDLYSITKEALQASVESYSLKETEKLAEYERKIDVREATFARRLFEAETHVGAADQVPQESLQKIEIYNQDDCEATLTLRDWLEGLYSDHQKELELTRPVPGDGAPSERVEQRNQQVAQLVERFRKLLPETDEYTKEDKINWLLMHMADYYGRENRVQWWEFFRINALELDDLLDERTAISHMSYTGQSYQEKRSTVHKYQFTPQDTDIAEGDKLTEIGGGDIGHVFAIDKINHTIDIKKAGKALEVHPSAVQANKVFEQTLNLMPGLHRFMEDVLQYGLENSGKYEAAKKLLMRCPPINVDDQSLRRVGESTVDAAIRLGSTMDRATLAIQGPPGTGKSHTGGKMIVDLLKKGKKVGVTAVSHKVIRNLLGRAKGFMEEESLSQAVVHVKTHPEKDTEDGIGEIKSKAAHKEVEKGSLVGGTSYLWVREEFDEDLDYLFVDEAGQMSLANVLAIAGSTKNIVLLGDPQQLEQPQQGAHPEGSDMAALNYLLGERSTIPPNLGLFIDETWRLPGAISRFTSELFYENRLQSEKDTQKISFESDSSFSGLGLRYVPVTHEGNQNQSDEEVEKVVAIVEEILAGDSRWTDRDGNVKAITSEDIMVVAPYNMQVNAIQEKLPDVRVGTVDRFQGQEAPVVIYSMTSSSAEDAPRGMSFLYNPNRLNVATSRAQCLCILVASPKLMEPACNTIDQMRWANALCRYRELAQEQ